MGFTKKIKKVLKKITKKTKNVTKKVAKKITSKYVSSKKKKTTRKSPKSCPKGKIMRAAYKKKSGKRVKSTCVPDKGRPGKGGLIKITPDQKHLSKYGYDLKHSSSTRQKALVKAIKAKSARDILRRLVLLRTYRKNDKTKAGKSQFAKLDKDVKFIQKKYFAKKH